MKLDTKRLLMEAHSHHASPDENDLWSCLYPAPSSDVISGPFATIETPRIRPIDSIGGLPRPIAAYLRTGECHQHDSLVPDDAISGTAECGVALVLT
jgi:hypothetical protein